MQRVFRSGLLILAFVVLLPGCSGYRVEGRVVQGPMTDIAFVAPSIAEAEAAGIQGARIDFHRDGGTLQESLVATVRSGPGGAVDLNLDAFGAGWMEESWRIVVTHPQFESAEVIMMLPPANADRRFYVTLARGQSTPPSDTLREQYERYK